MIVISYQLDEREWKVFAQQSFYVHALLEHVWFNVQGKLTKEINFNTVENLNSHMKDYMQFWV